MNRLATAQSQATSGTECWGQSYTYDRYANLSAIAVTKCSTPILNLSINQTTNRITNTGFVYDAAGNLTNDGASAFTWNAESRMATTAGVTYDYDGDGKRVKKSNGKLYWYGQNGEVLAESDLSGNVISEYAYFNGKRIVRRDPPSGKTYYYFADRLGSARMVVQHDSGWTWPSGAWEQITVVEEADFLPYGTERVVYNDPNTPDNTYKFTGHERDSESNLDHTLYRQYASTMGRWHSPDPMRGNTENPQSWNRYAYVTGDPANKTDPMGLCSPQDNPPCYSTVVTGNYPYNYFDLFRGGAGSGGSWWNPYWGSGNAATRFERDAERAERRDARRWDRAVALAEEGVHTVLDLAGLAPGAGEVADLTNAILYGLGGDYVNAGVSLAAILPIGGQAATSQRVFRRALQERTGIEGIGQHAHHIFPQAPSLIGRFKEIGINVWDTSYAAWWEARDHLRNAWQYNQDWTRWFRENADATAEDALKYGKELAEKYGFTFNP